jgi:hypothetical protein
MTGARFSCAYVLKRFRRRPVRDTTMTKVLSFMMLAAVLAVTVAACTGPKYERNAIFDNNCSHHSFLPPGDGFCEKYTAGK